MAVPCKFRIRRPGPVSRVLTSPFRIIGAEDGIYEFHIDLFNRKFFSSVTMR